MLSDGSQPVNSPPPAWDIYAQQLFHHRYGYPLWMPEYDPRLGEVEIGDVGYVSEGAFIRLFNAMRPADDPLNADGVPDGFVMLVPNPRLLKCHYVARLTDTRTWTEYGRYCI